MFPDTPIVYDMSQFFNEEIPTRKDPNATGVMWEVPLEKSLKTHLEKINQLDLSSLGPNQRKVTLLALPSSGTLNDLNTVTRNISMMVNDVRYDEILTDCPPNSRMPKAREESHFLRNQKTSNALQEKILERPETTKKFLELGQKIWERAQEKAESYQIKFFGTAVNLSQFLESNTLTSSCTDAEKVKFFISLVSFLNNSYDFKNNSDSEQIDIKTLFFETLNSDRIANTYAQYDAFMNALCASVDELKEINEQEAFFKRVQELLAVKPTDQDKAAIKFKEIFETSQEGAEEIIKSLREGDVIDTLSKWLGLMHRMLADDKEQEIIQERAAWKKAWTEGDIKTLRNLDGCQMEIDYPDSAVKEIGLKIIEHIEQNISSLFVLPLNAVIGTDLIDFLLEKNVPVVHVVKQQEEIQKVKGIFYRIISEEGKEVGHLLGSIHIANAEMLRLNQPIWQALKKADSIYLETAKEIATGLNVKLTLPLDLQETQRKKLETFVQLLFPKLMEVLIEKGASSQILNSLSYQFKHGNLETKINLVNSQLSQLRYHQAKIVHFQDLFNGIPLGIDQLLATYAHSKKKNLFGLEEDTLQRLDLTTQSANFDFFSPEAIENLPSNEEAADIYITKQIDQFTKICEAWTSGDEDFIAEASNDYKGNQELHEKLWLDRNRTMAANIHQALLSRKGQGTLFFSVGSGHIVGEENIKELLEKMGWKLERVSAHDRLIQNLL